jgi:hypothetical protein
MNFQYAPPEESKFEAFCVSFLRDFWPNSAPELYGRRGQGQQGVDIIDVSGEVTLRAAQCKWKSLGTILSVKEFKAEVAKALKVDLQI